MKDSVSVSPSRQAAQAIANICPDAFFCGFNTRTSESGDVRKIPINLKGTGVSADIDRAHLVKADALNRSPDIAQYWGVVMQWPVHDPFGDLVLTVLDLDAKNSTAPQDLRMKRLLTAAKERGLMTERSHSRKGSHIIFLCKPDDTIPAKIPLGNSQDVEVFGHPRSAGKSVMLTGDSLAGDVIELGGCTLREFLTEVGITEKELSTSKAKTTDTATFTPVANHPAQSLSEEVAAATRALDCIPADIGYDEWIMIGQALQVAFGASGLEMWHAWSSGGSKFKGTKDLETHWRSFKPNGGVTIASLFHLAKQHGYAAQAYSGVKFSSAADDFNIRVISSPRPPSTADQVDDDGVIWDDDVPTEMPALVWPHMTAGKNPKPLSTIENFAALTRYLNVEFSLNVISGREEIVIPGLNVDSSTYDNSAITWLISEAKKAGLPSEQVPEYASMMCALNSYNPAANWIDSKPWDGISRLADWFATIKSDNEPLKCTLMRKWAISAVASVFRPHGTSSHGVLTLLGAQNIGKTSWFKRLVPQHLGLSKDGLILRPEDRDSVKQATSYWMVELGEIDATFRKADIAALKAFITADCDVYRAAYARKETIKPRRTVFFASVNDERFLNDPTGNRRYWTINCHSINWQHDIDMQQLWAEVKLIYETGESWYLSGEEIDTLNTANEEFTATDPIEEKLHERLDFEAPMSTWTWKTVTAILEMCGWSGRPTKAETIAAGRAIRKLTGRRDTRKSNGVSTVLCPPIAKQFLSDFD